MILASLHSRSLVEPQAVLGRRLGHNLHDHPVISSLLLALGVGVVVQLVLSWTLGPGWGSSLALITVGWSLFLLLARSQDQDKTKD